MTGTIGTILHVAVEILFTSAAIFAVWAIHESIKGNKP
jgi:hypothetical protein